jgi:hypothetical protein
VSVPVTAAVEFSAPGTTTGENVTSTLQDAPTASVVQSLVCPNCAPSEIPVKLTTPPVLLVIVTSRASEVVAIDWPPKSSDTGLIESGVPQPAHGVTFTGGDCDPSPAALVALTVQL